MIQHTQLSPIERFFNAVMGLLFRLGWAPRYGHELEVVGRKSGRPHRTPVNMLTVDEHLYLVAPRGDTQWAKNARAAGVVTLHRGSSHRQYRVAEVPVRERAPLLKSYLTIYESQVSRFFSIRASASLADFEAIAAEHPVFRLAPAG